MSNCTICCGIDKMETDIWTKWLNTVENIFSLARNFCGANDFCEHTVITSEYGVQNNWRGHYVCYY